MSGILKTAFLPGWVAFSVLIVGLAILATERVGGAQISARTQGRIVGTACIYSEVITDCNDDYWCNRTDPGNPPDPTKCPSDGSCVYACSATTGTYQDVDYEGNQSREQIGPDWNCGKTYVSIPNCAYYSTGQTCRCSTAGTASTTDCLYHKYSYSNCGGT